ncbi:RNA-directed DNA polymerase, eukaryota, reverse transcriptase zinc-binding domain protein [Tanacetum coccineum]
MKVKESLNVTFDETLPPPKTSPLEDDDLVEEEAIEKQTALAISTTEAEYVSARKACQQALWMKQALVDYGIRLDDIPIMCDNKGAIDLIIDDGKMGVITRAGSKSCWMNIVHETNALLNKGIDLIKFMRIKLGNGQITSFWEDMWSEGGTLKNRYPRIYALESSKSITVGMKVAHTSLAFSFRRAPRGGVEQEQFDEIVALVNDVILAPISYRWTWTLESSGDFFVASVRKLIDDKSIPVVDYKTRWIKYVPIKVNVHAWKVKSDSLPTRFNISRRGIYIDSIMCAICDKRRRCLAICSSRVAWSDKLFALSLAGGMLESIRSHFFNGHDPNSKRTSWVKWKNVLASKEKGGLGVSSLYALNRGLMFKWVWRFFTQNTSLWSRVIKAIHGEDGKVGKQVKSAFPSYWMDIVHEINVLKNQGINLLNCMQMKLGNGDKTAFWEDIWIGHIVLKDLYPRIYALETCKFVKVGTKLTQSSLDFSFRRKPRGGIEQEQYEALLVQMLDDKMLPDVTTKTRWIKLVPIKVCVHAWKVKIDSLLTRFNISRRDIIRKITRWWDITYIEADSYEDWLNWLVNLRLSSNYKQALEGDDF